MRLRRAPIAPPSRGDDHPAIEQRPERQREPEAEAAPPPAPPERTPLPPPLPGRGCTHPDGCGLARRMDPTTGAPIDGVDRCGLHS